MESTLNAFIADSNYDHCSQNINFLSYYWDSEYDVDGDDMIDIDVRICCGEEGAVFSASYSPPSGYTYQYGEAFTDIDDDGDIDDDDMIKQIIVFSICGLLLCLCIIAAIFLFKRYRNKKKQTKLETETSNVITETKREQTNIEAISPSSTN